MGAKKKEALEQFNRDNILAAAQELFDRNGIGNTTMDDIASFADYSKSTIYVYFKSKEDIYNSILEKAVYDLSGNLRRLIDGGREFEKVYYLVCDALVSFAEGYPGYFAGMLSGQRFTNGRKRQNTIDNSMLYEELDEAFTELINLGIDCNVLREDVDVKPTVWYLWSSVCGIIQISHRRKDMLAKKLRMTQDEYLRYSFRTLYESLIRR